MILKELILLIKIEIQYTIFITLNYIKFIFLIFENKYILNSKNHTKQYTICYYKYINTNCRAITSNEKKEVFKC